MEILEDALSPKWSSIDRNLGLPVIAQQLSSKRRFFCPQMNYKNAEIGDKSSNAIALQGQLSATDF
jgi:hypothetical protein